MVTVQRGLIEKPLSVIIRKIVVDFVFSQLCASLKWNQGVVFFGIVRQRERGGLLFAADGYQLCNRLQQ